MTLQVLTVVFLSTCLSAKQNDISEGRPPFPTTHFYLKCSIITNMNSGENKRKHLEMIQSVISRLYANLFYLKGWAITLVAALFALVGTENHGDFVYVTIVPVVMLWIVDGYFLSRERRYRKLYDEVSELDEKEINFSMDARKHGKVARNTWAVAMLAIPSICFYGLLAIITIVLARVIKY